MQLGVEDMISLIFMTREDIKSLLTVLAWYPLMRRERAKDTSTHTHSATPFLVEENASEMSVQVSSYNDLAPMQMANSTDKFFKVRI